MTPADPPRKRLGELSTLVLYLVLVFGGAAILAAYFIVPALLAPDPGLRFGAMQVGALLALPPLVVYAWLPRLVGRLDPKPWWYLALALLFGALAACGLSALSNTLFEHALVVTLGSFRDDASTIAAFVGASLGAPLIEELWKGLAVVFAFRSFRRGLDGVVDGVIYATFSALGFATVENVIYYARAAFDEVTLAREGALAAAVMMRGVFSPWTHPLYTSLIGLGFGISRESSSPRAKRLAPVLGYLGAVALHAIWNGAAMLSDDFTDVLLPLGVVFVLGFGGLFAGLGLRHVRILRAHLQDEVARGTLTEAELRLVLSPIARLRATISYGGPPGAAFVSAAARLAFLRWHEARAHPVRASLPDVESLRLELARYRSQMQRRSRQRGALGFEG